MLDLRQWWWRYRGDCIWLLVASIAAWWLLSIANYVGQQHQPAAYRSVEDQRILIIAFARGPIGVFVRFWIFLRRHPDGFFAGITAVATLAIATFTFTLYTATSEQARLTRSIAEISERQTEAAIAAESPRLYFADFKLVRYEGPEGQVLEDPVSGSPFGFLRPLVLVNNGGRVPMPIRRLCLDWAVTKALPETPIYRGPSGAVYLVPKENTIWLLDHTSGFELSDAQITEIQNGTAHLWLYGFVAYSNHIGDTFEHGFAARWNSVTGRFEGGGPQAYTYEKRTKAGLPKPS